jgi:hypothetical protein
MARSRVILILSALVILASASSAVAGSKRTVLLIPFATNQAGFDTSVSLANTTADPFGDKTAAGTCTFTYFSQSGASPAPQTSTEVGPGRMLVFVLSAGGSNGIQARPAFQGYIVVDCAFPHAIATAYVASGPSFQNAASVPVTEIKAKDRK